MNRIQRLFELIVGITREERNRWALVDEIYNAPRMDVMVLRTPACWRRKANVRGIKH